MINIDNIEGMVWNISLKELIHFGGDEEDLKVPSLKYILKGIDTNYQFVTIFSVKGFEIYP